jgi:hypothetical protein
LKVDVINVLRKTTSYDTASVMMLYLGKFKAHLDIKDSDYFNSEDFIDFIDSLNYNKIEGYEELTSAKFWQQQCEEA